MSLIYGILTTQKPDLVTPIDILGPPVAKMRINHKLYEGHHFRDVPSWKNIGKIKEKVPKCKQVVASIVQSSSVTLLKTEILDKTIRSHEIMLNHLYEQQQQLESQLQGI